MDASRIFRNNYELESTFSGDLQPSIIHLGNGKAIVRYRILSLFDDFAGLSSELQLEVGEFKGIYQISKVLFSKYSNRIFLLTIAPGEAIAKKIVRTNHESSSIDPPVTYNFSHEYLDAAWNPMLQVLIVLPKDQPDKRFVYSTLDHSELPIVINIDPSRQTGKETQIGINESRDPRSVDRSGDISFYVVVEYPSTMQAYKFDGTPTEVHHRTLKPRVFSDTNPIKQLLCPPQKHFCFFRGERSKIVLWEYKNPLLPSHSNF